MRQSSHLSFYKEKQYVDDYLITFMACLDGGGKEGEWRGVE